MNDGSNYNQGGGGLPINSNLVGALLMSAGTPMSAAMLTSADLENKRYMAQLEAQKMYMENLKTMYGRQTNPETGETYTLGDDLASRGLMPNSPMQNNMGGGQTLAQSNGAPQGNAQAGGGMPGSTTPQQGSTPIPSDSPLQGMTPKQIYAQKAEDFKAMQGAEANAMKSADDLRVLQSLKEAYDNVETGPGTSALATINKYLGTNFKNVNPGDVEFIKSQLPQLFKDVLQNMGSAGKMSPAIIQLLTQNAPSPDNEKSANDRIFNLAFQRASDPAQQSMAMKQYFKTYGTTIGFDDKWAAYSANPNDYNSGNWMKYVTRQPQGQQAQSISTNATANAANMASPAVAQNNTSPILQALYTERARRQGIKK